MTAPVIDAAAHPVAPTGDEIRTYMREPWRSKPFPGPERYQYASPFGEYADGTTPASGLPGSDPDLLERQLVAGHGVAKVVLVPLTRGLLANVDLASAVCAATNEWLADVWLGRADGERRLYGSIRVDPRDPDAAVAEIERRAANDAFVQIAVPLQSQHPYGQRMFWRIWEAAAAAGLPVAIHADGGSSVEFHPTAAGPIRYALEYGVLHALNVAYHLASFVAEGVFERVPELRVVCADGGLSQLVPIVWRLDRDWRSTREEIPWAKRLPSEYVVGHVRFCLHEADLPTRDGPDAEWWELAQASRLLLYSSNYPQRDFLAPDVARARFDDERALRIMFGNAAELYRLDSLPNAQRRAE